MSFGLSSVGQQVTGLRTDVGFVDLMSAQLNDFLESQQRGSTVEDDMDGRTSGWW